MTHGKIISTRYHLAYANKNGILVNTNHVCVSCELELCTGAVPELCAVANELDRYSARSMIIGEKRGLLVGCALCKSSKHPSGARDLAAKMIPRFHVTVPMSEATLAEFQ